MGSLAGLIQIVCYALLIAIFLRVAFSWIGNQSRGRAGQLYELTYRITEPLLRPVRNLLPMGGGMDFSPMIVSFVLFGIISLSRNL